MMQNLFSSGLGNPKAKIVWEYEVHITETLRSNKYIKDQCDLNCQDQPLQILGSGMAKTRTF